MSSLICLCSSAAFKFSILNFSCSAAASVAAFAKSTSAFAPSNVALAYSVTASAVFVSVSPTFCVVLSTPVTTSTTSLPASLTLSKAPEKSPLNTFTTASPKKPKTLDVLLLKM